MHFSYSYTKTVNLDQLVTELLLQSINPEWMDTCGDTVIAWFSAPLASVEQELLSTLISLHIPL